MNFSISEKCAIIKALEELMHADGVVENSEIAYMLQLSDVMGFDGTIIDRSRMMNIKDATIILENMSIEKKELLAMILHQMAIADGYFENQEAAVLIAVMKAAGIDILKHKQKEDSFQLNEIQFESNDHIRYEKNVPMPGSNKGAKRLINIEPNIEGKPGYTVAIYNLMGKHPFWKDNVQMAPKQMIITHKAIDEIVLRGYGFDNMGGSYADYGITLKIKNNEIEYCVLHLHDRNINIKYLR